MDLPQCNHGQSIAPKQINAMKTKSTLRLGPCHNVNKAHFWPEETCVQTTYVLAENSTKQINLRDLA